MSQPRFAHICARATVPWLGKTQDLVVVADPEQSDPEQPGLVEAVAKQVDACGAIRILYIRPSAARPSAALLTALQVYCLAIAVGEGTLDEHCQFTARVEWRSDNFIDGRPVISDKLILMVPLDSDVISGAVIRWRVR